MRYPSSPDDVAFVLQKAVTPGHRNSLEGCRGCMVKNHFVKNACNGKIIIIRMKNINFGLGTISRPDRPPEGGTANFFDLADS